MLQFVSVVLLLLGFVGLIKGADLFVDGSASLAKTFQVPGVIIGLTVVAMGTSAPELAVSTSAAIKGANEIAYSNVVGSNLMNLLLVLGVCSIIRFIPVDPAIIKRDFPFSIGITILLLLFGGAGTIFAGKLSGNMAENAGELQRICGLIFLVIFLFYIGFLIYNAKKNPTEETDEIKTLPVWKCILFILIGLVLIVGGGQAVVWSATNIAKFLGMTETLIGLTVVACGTSLPELVTSVVASKKGENGMAVGNVVGSNIFNILLILGVSTSIHPVAINMASIYDTMILIGINLLLFIIVCVRKKVERGTGILMVLLYVCDVIYAIARG